jgi:hypothetical protein
MTTAGRKERQNTKLIQAFQLTSGDTVGDGNWVLCEEGAQQIGLSIVFSSFFTWMHIVSRRKMKKNDSAQYVQSSKTASRTSPFSG